MTLAVKALEEIVDKATNDDDVMHLVCHCSNDEISACGLDCSEVAWHDVNSSEPPCPMCVIVWPEGSPCPWGCECEECFSPDF